MVVQMSLLKSRFRQWSSNQDVCRDAAPFNPRARSTRCHLATRRVHRSTSNEPEKFEYHYETALVALINSKRSGKLIRPKERPRGENVVDLMDALRKSVGGAAAETKAPKKSAKKPRQAAAGQKEPKAAPHIISATTHSRFWRRTWVNVGRRKGS